MTYISQDQKVLAYLQQGNTLSQLEATNLFNCCRLSSVIHRLRNLGHLIDTYQEPNTYNKGRHARYKYED